MPAHHPVLKFAWRVVMPIETPVLIAPIRHHTAIGRMPLEQCANSAGCVQPPAVFVDGVDDLPDRAAVGIALQDGAGTADQTTQDAVFDVETVCDWVGRPDQPIMLPWLVAHRERLKRVVPIGPGESVGAARLALPDQYPARTPSSVLDHRSVADGDALTADDQRPLYHPDLFVVSGGLGRDVLDEIAHTDIDPLTGGLHRHRGTVGVKDQIEHG